MHPRHKVERHLALIYTLFTHLYLLLVLTIAGEHTAIHIEVNHRSGIYRQATPLLLGNHRHIEVENLQSRQVAIGVGVVSCQGKRAIISLHKASVTIQPIVLPAKAHTGGDAPRLREHYRQRNRIEKAKFHRVAHVAHIAGTAHQREAIVHSQRSEPIHSRQILFLILLARKRREEGDCIVVIGICRCLFLLSRVVVAEFAVQAAATHLHAHSAIGTFGDNDFVWIQHLHHSVGSNAVGSFDSLHSGCSRHSQYANNNRISFHLEKIAVYMCVKNYFLCYFPVLISFFTFSGEASPLIYTTTIRAVFFPESASLFT